MMNTFNFNKQMLYYCKGYPGSGKSTLARKMVGESAYLCNPQNAARTGDLKYKLVRVNRDDLRVAHPKWKRGKFDSQVEKDVLRQRDEAIKAALDAGLSVISDDTNLGPKYDAHWSSVAKKYNIPVVCINFMDPDSEYYVSVDKCIKQDLLRDFSVGRDIIIRMWDQFSSKDDPVDPKILEYLPKAVICDLDGTLAHATDRSPYDDTKYDTDLVDRSIFWLLHRLESDCKILIVSGREATQTAEKQTINWLKSNDVPYHELYMRKCGDSRSDTIVKREIWEQKIKFRYDVVFCLDDRKKVIREWISCGLKVLDCGLPYDFDIAK